MQTERRVFCSMILPLMILISLVWIMTGCFYFPFFEHRIEGGPNVRAMVGDADSNRQIRPGRITKAQVVAMLGPSRWVSYDGRALGYTTYTGMGTWVWPLCFAALPADNKVYAVRLEFDKDDWLVRYQWADAVMAIPPLQIGGPHGLDELAAIEKLNRTGPVLLDQRNPRSTTQP